MGGTKQTANHIASDFGKILHRVTVMREPIECQIRRLHWRECGAREMRREPVWTSSLAERAFGCGRWAVLALLGISDCRSHISDLRFEICHLKSQRACPQPHSRSPRSLPAAPFMFLGAHSAHFSRERGLSRSQGDVRYWSYLRALNPTSKTFGGREAEVHRPPLRGRPLSRPLFPTMRHWSEGIRRSIVAPHRRFEPELDIFS